jgi:hypothetical protein
MEDAWWVHPSEATDDLFTEAGASEHVVAEVFQEFDA